MSSHESFAFGSEPRVLSVSFDPASDVLTVEGVRYAGALFRGIGIAPLNQFMLVEHRAATGVVTIRRFSPELNEQLRRVANLPPAPSK